MYSYVLSMELLSQTPTTTTLEEEPLSGFSVQSFPRDQGCSIDSQSPPSTLRSWVKPLSIANQVPPSHSWVLAEALIPLGLRFPSSREITLDLSSPFLTMNQKNFYTFKLLMPVTPYTYILSPLLLSLSLQC